MMWLWNNAEKLGNLAQIFTAVVAIIALSFAYLQVRSIRQSQREATAKGLYRDYLMLAFKHPNLATPEKDKNLIQRDDYRWFVSVLLNCCDEILDTVDDDTWRKVIAAELQYHIPYLKSKYFLDLEEDKGWSLYSEKLARVFREAYP
jgi:hypothetical protein